MKKLHTLMLLALFAPLQSALSQCGGMPISHSHPGSPGTGGICYGFAMAAAIHATCTWGTAYPDASGINTTYFLRTSKEPAVGDIVEFDNGQHFGYVSGVNPLLVDHVPAHGDPPLWGQTLDLVGRGPVTGVYKRRFGVVP